MTEDPVGGTVVGAGGLLRGRRAPRKREHLLLGFNQRAAVGPRDLARPSGALLNDGDALADGGDRVAPGARQRW
jgi:hypothetical protein